MFGQNSLVYRRWGILPIIFVKFAEKQNRWGTVGSGKYFLSGAVRHLKQVVKSAWLLQLYQIRSDQSLSRVQLFATPWIAARQASLSITNSRSSLRLTSIESVMPSSHLILCHPLLLLPLIPPSIRVFSNESTFRMRWPKYLSFSFSIIPSKEIPGLISFRMDRLDCMAGANLKAFVGLWFPWYYWLNQ